MEGGIVEERTPKGKKVGGRRLHNALSERTVRTAKVPGRYFDGQGLFLMVQPSGAKSWVQRVTVRGRRQELGLGGYPVVTLQMAREAALVNRREVRNGGNPKTNRQRARGVPTFAEAAHKVYTSSGGPAGGAPSTPGSGSGRLRSSSSLASPITAWTISRRKT